MSMTDTLAAPAAVNKADLVDQLLPRVRSAIMDRRQVVVVDGKPFRHQNGNDKFQDETGRTMLAMATGLYSRMQVSVGSGLTSDQWLHLGGPAEFERLMRPYLERMPAPALEELQVVVNGNAAARKPAGPRP